MSLTGRCGNVVQYISDTLGIIWCKSEKILFHKKSVQFPENIDHNLQIYIPLGKRIHFDAQFVNYGDDGIMVATSVWRGKKRNTHVACPTSVYTEYFSSSNLYERENSNIGTDLEFDDKCYDAAASSCSYSGPNSSSNPQMDAALLTSHTQTNEDNPLLHRELKFVSFDFKKIIPDAKKYMVSGVMGTVVQYFSDNFGIMKCIIHNYPRNVFFSLNMLQLPEHLGTVPLRSLLPVHETLAVNIDVYRHGKIAFYNIRSVNIDIKSLQQRASSTEIHFKPHFAEGTNLSLPENFTKLKGIVSSHSSKKEGCIQYEVDGTVMKINFHRRNVYFPENKTDLTLKTHLPVKSQVYFNVSPQYSGNNTKFTASLVYPETKPRKLDSSYEEMNGKEMFFCAELFKVGTVVACISEEEAVVQSSVLSVSCCIHFYKSDVVVRKWFKDFDFSESFSPGTKVHFDAKIFGYSEGIKVKIINVFPFEVIGGVVSKVRQELMQVNMEREGQEFVVDVKKGKFHESFFNRSIVNDLRDHVSEGDEVMVEMIVFKNSSVGIGIKLHKCVKMKASEGIKVKAETDPTPYLNTLTPSTQNDEATNIKVNSNEYSKNDAFFESQEMHRNKIIREVSETVTTPGNFNIDQNTHSLENFQQLKNNEHIENIPMTELRNLSSLTDVRYYKLIQNLIVRNYFKAGLKGHILKYLSNDLGIVICLDDGVKHLMFFTRDSLVFSDSICPTVPLSCLLPTKYSCNVDVEVFIHEDGSQFFQVKAVRVEGEQYNNLICNLENINSMINSGMSFQSMPLTTDFSQAPVSGFLTLKGEIASYSTKSKGLIKYEMFGSDRYIQFSGKNFYTDGTKPELALRKCVPVGTLVIFSAFFVNFILKGDSASFVCLDSSAANTNKSLSSVSSPQNKTEPVCGTYFNIKPNLIGTIVGHISDDEAVLQCEIESVTCMTSFTKLVIPLGKREKDIQLSVDWPVGTKVKFSAKIICLNDLLKIVVLEIRPVFCLLGIVTNIHLRTLHVRVDYDGIEETLRIKKKSFQICGRSLKHAASLRNYISKGDSVLVEVITPVLSKGSVNKHVVSVVPHQELGNASSTEKHDSMREIGNEISHSGSVSQRNETIFSGTVCDVNETIVVISCESFGSLTFKKKRICLYGVYLHKYNIEEVFKKGVAIDFSLCCGKSRLCVGGHPKPETKDEIRLKLHDFSIKMKIRLHILKRLVEDFYLLYASQDDKYRCSIESETSSGSESEDNDNDESNVHTLQRTDNMESNSDFSEMTNEYTDLKLGDPLCDRNAGSVSSIGSMTKFDFNNDVRQCGDNSESMSDFWWSETNDRMSLKNDELKSIPNVEEASSSTFEVSKPAVLKAEEICALDPEVNKILSKMNDRTFAVENEHVSVFDPKFISVLKSLLSEKISENVLGGMPLELNVDETIDIFENNMKDLLLNDILDEAIIHCTSNASGMLQNQNGNEDMCETVVNNIVCDNVSSSEPCFTSSFAQTISTGPVVSLNHVVE